MITFTSLEIQNVPLFFFFYCSRVESSEQLTSHQRQKSRVFATKDTEERRGEELQIPWIKTSPSIPWILTNWTTTIKNPLPQLPTLLLLLLKLSDNQNGIPGMIKFWSSNRGYVSIWHLVQVTKSSTSFHFLLSALCLCYQSWFMFLLTFFFFKMKFQCVLCACH
jgi:hypothetical protein